MKESKDDFTGTTNTISLDDLESTHLAKGTEGIIEKVLQSQDYISDLKYLLTGNLDESVKAASTDYSIVSEYSSSSDLHEACSNGFESTNRAKGPEEIGKNLSQDCIIDRKYPLTGNLDESINAWSEDYSIVSDISDFDEDCFNCLETTNRAKRLEDIEKDLSQDYVINCTYLERVLVKPMDYTSDCETSLPIDLDEALEYFKE